MDFKSLLKKAVGFVENELKQQPLQQKPTQSRPAQPQQPQKPEPEPERERTSAEWFAYFRQILTQEFGQYAVRENVPVQELAGDISAEFQLYATRPQQAYKAEWGLPYTYVLYSGDSVRGVILLAKRQNQSRNVKFLISKMYAKKMNIPFVSFYMDAPNEHDYVVERIRSYVH